MTVEAPQEYSAKSVRALSGLEAVFVRPGMYVGSTGKQGFHHLLWEIVDNSVDEAMGGYCNRIEVTLNADGSASVADNGRGIPVDPQPDDSEYPGMPTVEMVLTVLHAGGKFDGNAYSFSGGLHGVGISVVNALSEWTKVDVKKDGQNHHIEFGLAYKYDAAGNPVYDHKGAHAVIPGKVTSPLESYGKVAKSDTGTSVTFLPTDKVFSYSGWDIELIARRLRHGSFLNPGLIFVLRDHRTEEHTEVEFHYPNGLKDFMDEVSIERLAASDNVGKTDELLPLEPILLGGEDPESGGEWSMCLRWFPDANYRSISFANGIETGHGGTHVKGYEQVLTLMMNRYAKQDHIGMIDEKSPSLEAVDVRAGLGVIIAAKVKEPQFVGQTKDELSNDETRIMIRQGFSEQFWNWMQEHPVEIKEILGKLIDGMRFRHRMAALEDAERSKAEKRGVPAKSQALPPKLSDCETRDRSLAELFIVEGDSAAAPAKKSRDSKTQAVLPIRGKGLNIENALNSKGGEDRIQGNKEVQGILATIGAGSQDLFDLDSMRYDKIIILTDADEDGRHIQLLLMTTFYRLCKPLVEAGRLYVARPPLFSATINQVKYYAHDMAGREEIEARFPRSNVEWMRFKGLGEMNFDQLGDTCLDPSQRRIVRINVDDPSVADQTIKSLMGGDTNAKWDAVQDVNVSGEELL